MPFNYENITTGLMSYSLVKEFYQNDSIPMRELERFSYEIYSSDVSGLSPTHIQNNIIAQFTGYSGNINVKVLEAPADFVFPNDSIRNSKFNVTIELRKAPSNITEYSELYSSYYAGLNPTFFTTNANNILDLKESFEFTQGENGHQSFEHSFGFELISGGQSLAASIASGLFSSDDATTFGISVMQNGITGANIANVQNYFSESYDLAKNTYSFSKKRDFYPDDAGIYNYNLTNIISLKEDGTFDVSERCDLQGKINFLQAKNGLEIVYAGALTRCESLYSTYQDAMGNFNSTQVLANLPTKISREYNVPELLASYNVTFTNNPDFGSAGDAIEEVIELNVNERNVVTITDRYNITFNRRDPNFVSAISLIQNAASQSNATMFNYYLNCGFYTSSWPLNLIKYDMKWPFNQNKVTYDAIFSNNPIYFVNINGVPFNSLETKIENTQPVDEVEEYKIINRPNQTSIISYAYQDSKGTITISFTAGVGKQKNEFSTGIFRGDVGIYTLALYKYGIELFFEQFANTIPIAWNYFLSDIKYSLNSQGQLNMTMIFDYTCKRYVL
jgi:hypothetical protein